MLNHDSTVVSHDRVEPAEHRRSIKPVEGATDRHQIRCPSSRRDEVLRPRLQERQPLTRARFHAVSSHRQQVRVDVDADHGLDAVLECVHDATGAGADIEQASRPTTGCGVEEDRGHVGR